MDRATLAAYDKDAAAFAQDWHDQPAPVDLQDIVTRFFVKGGRTADIGCGSGRDFNRIVPADAPRHRPRDEVAGQGHGDGRDEEGPPANSPPVHEHGGHQHGGGDLRGHPEQKDDGKVTRRLREDSLQWAGLVCGRPAEFPGARP